MNSITGVWKLTEMQWLAEALAAFSGLLGGKGLFAQLVAGNRKVKIDYNRDTCTLGPDFCSRWNVNGGGLAGHYDSADTVTLVGQDLPTAWVPDEDQGLAYPEFFKETVIHELAHVLAVHNRAALKSFEQTVGWKYDSASHIFTRVPAAASSYALLQLQAGNPLASEEDFADHVSYAALGRMVGGLAVDNDYRLAMRYLHWWAVQSVRGWGR